MDEPTCYDPPGDHPTMDFGACCACGWVGLSVRNLVMLPFRAPTPGTGWGCLECGQPQDGALAVVCDACVERGATVREVFVNFADRGERTPLAEVEQMPFTHDVAIHAQIDRQREARRVSHLN